MAKRPKRKIDSQILLFDVEEFTTGSTEEVLFEDDVFDDLEEIFDETNPTDVGLITNEILSYLQVVNNSIIFRKNKWQN